MIGESILKKTVLLSVICLFTLTLGAAKAMAHCDAKNGPVASDARNALASGDFQTVAIWVGEKQHEELRSAFDQALPVYKTGGKAKELATQYFMETAVRLHRQAEGMTYTGLKPAQQLPEDIAKAEKALQTGNLKPVTTLLTETMQSKLQDVFDAAYNAKQNKEDSLEAGREWADAYVKYVIYVHGLYKTIQAGPAHGVGE